MITKVLLDIFHIRKEIISYRQSHETFDILENFSFSLHTEIFNFPIWLNIEYLEHLTTKYDTMFSIVQKSLLFLREFLTEYIEESYLTKQNR